MMQLTVLSNAHHSSSLEKYVRFMNSLQELVMDKGSYSWEEIVQKLLMNSTSIT